MKRTLTAALNGTTQRSVAVAVGVAMLLSVAYLLAPPLGTDLSAQVARADFFVSDGFTPIDMRWYAGVNQFGYSMFSQVPMGALGVRVTAVLSLLVAAGTFAALLARYSVPRPVLGSAVGAVCIAGNLASGRVTYSLGVAFGLLALLAASAHHPGNSARHRGFRYALTAATAFLAAVTSPVAGLFVGLVAVALILSRHRIGVVLAAGAAVGIAVTGLIFGAGGTMNISPRDTFGAVTASLIVAVFTAYKPVRIAAILSAAGVLAAYVIDTPVGLNATRLATMFALPILVATGRLPAWPRAWKGLEGARTLLVAAGAGVAVLVLAPPVVLADLGDAGNPANEAGYYAPLVVAASARNAQRIEVVPTRNYWEAAYIAPLARGWLRQVDRARNPLFFEKLPHGEKLTADNYRAWLHDNAVSHVALADAELSWLAKPEAELIRGGLPYLTEVWRDEHWRLYAVADATPLVQSPSGPAVISEAVEVVDHTASSVTFDAHTDGEVLIKVRFSRWLTMPGVPLRPGPGGWTLAEIPEPGRYTLTSDL